MFRGRGARDFRQGLVLGVAGVLLAVAGCSGDPTAADDGPYNSADVAFAQRTITHHRHALELTALAERRAEDPRVQELADDIEATQEAEIEQLAGWLDEWGEDVPEADTPADEKLPGLVSEDQLVKLSASSGAAWRELFLTYLIEHARGAIELAADEEANGKHPGALELAAEIQVAQQAEIQRIEALLG